MESVGRKTNKTRRETAVQGTNDSSIVSKCSTSSCGYFNDPFLHFFVSKLSRRAPLIHRGYYIRAVAFDRIVKNFLEVFGKDSRKQIISLGCGFDSTYFRLKASGHLKNTIFCEIDFPEVVKRKCLLIDHTDELLALIEKNSAQPCSPHIELSCSDYHLLGVDLTQLNTLEAALKICGVNFDVPTLLLSECVLTYMTRRCSTELVKWASETFEQAVFGMYEQINPDDAFGLFMQHHFHSIGSPLKCINAFPTLESQLKRFLNTGWVWCEAFDMNTFYYQFVPAEEKRRIECLETFDEYEELNLKYSHYFILTASTTHLAKSLITDITTSIDFKATFLPPSVPSSLTFERLPEDDESVRRFGHASSLISNRYAVTSGGFGEIDGRHQRLCEITITDTVGFKSFHVPCYLNHVQYSRMHHASVTLSDGTTFLIGGRQSPYFMCDQMLKLNLFISSDHQHCDSHTNSGLLNSFVEKSTENISTQSYKNTELHSEKHVASKRTLSSNCLKEHNTEPKDAPPQYNDEMSNPCEPEAVICCDKADDIECNLSNKDTDLSATSWPFQLGHVEVSIVSQKGFVPKERWRHAAVAVVVDGQEKIFIHGGKTKSCQVLGDSFLFDPVSNCWSELTCTGEVPGPRHSHCVSYWNGHVIMTGGVDPYHEPIADVLSLDLVSGVWSKLNITGTLYPRYSHTAHLVEDKIVLIGGVNTHHPPPGVAVINLTTQRSMEFALPNQEKKNLLMFHRHTSILLDSDDIIVLGGGGNCFSFGTHLNRTPVILSVESCLNAV
ncbi:tRNA wybutosine-synthesizing protein 4-like [Physella acuta]|uniref:tRNA wybutosine-synthesizing protein 4-like n=1 Tax=Physella acuta TaxID=109671 RepID=UPI0027DD1178|nr:tRNA wybutosine-synthesizing protein 4-like [Physella acuta]